MGVRAFAKPVSEVTITAVVKNNAAAMANIRMIDIGLSPLKGRIHLQPADDRCHKEVTASVTAVTTCRFAGRHQSARLDAGLVPDDDYIDYMLPAMMKTLFHDR